MDGKTALSMVKGYFDVTKGWLEQIDGLRCREKLLALVGHGGEEVCASRSF
jgi:hypothetical protein